MKDQQRKSDRPQNEPTQPKEIPEHRPPNDPTQPKEIMPGPQGKSGAKTNTGSGPKSHGSESNANKDSSGKASEPSQGRGETRGTPRHEGQKSGMPKRSGP